MNQPTSQPASLKPFPKNATKSEVYEMYKTFGKKRVRSAMQLAVDTVNSRKKIKFTKKTTTLTSHHLAIIFDELGQAEGYESPGI